MLTLVLLCALMTSQGVQAWGTTGWGITASPSCRNNCGGYFGYCDCTYSCIYYGNCCWDFYTYCSTAGTTPGQTTPGQTTPGQTTPGQTTPGQTTPGQTTPGQTTPGQTTPGTTVGQTTPGQTTPGTTVGQTTESPSCENACERVFGSCSCSYRCESLGNCCKDYYPFCVGTTYAPQATTTLETTANPYDTAATHDYTCWHNCEHDMAMCSCSYRCEYYGNCCYDYYAFCVGTTYPSETTASYPPATTQGGSCWNNCGRDLGVCSCLYGCQYRGDCCGDYSWYCPVTTYEPDTTPGYTESPPSCRNNCWQNFGSCSCSSSCKNRGNCCWDYDWYCPITTPDPYTTPGYTEGPSCRRNCGNDFWSCSCASSCERRGNCCRDYYSYCYYPTTYSPSYTTGGGSCGGYVSGSGSFASPNYPYNYNNNDLCNWLIQTSPGQTLYLVFTFLELEHCCNCDYILVYDGKSSANSRLLGKVCDDSSNNATAFHSSSNYLTVIFRTDHSVVGRGFNAEVTSSLSPGSGRVDCSSDNMNIVVSKSYLDSLGIDAHNLYLNDQYCRPDITYYNVVFNFPINTCGTVRKFEHGRIVYTNALRSFPSSYGEITRQSVYKLGVSCRMEEDSFSQIIYEVKHGENISISGSGRYNTSMSFYTSSSFYYEVTQVPYLVRLNQNLYVQVSLRRGDSALVLFLDTCVASPSPHDFQTRSYDLIRNGCRVDSTFYSYSSGTRPYARFRFKAFQFLRATEHVYIQCKVLICPASDYNSRCRRGCSKRKARDLESEHHSETVVLGPIQLLEEDKGAEEAEPETKG